MELWSACSSSRFFHVCLAVPGRQALGIFRRELNARGTFLRRMGRYDTERDEKGV